MGQDQTYGPNEVVEELKSLGQTNQAAIFWAHLSDYLPKQAFGVAGNPNGAVVHPCRQARLQSQQRRMFVSAALAPQKQFLPDG